ncbi:MAG: sulfatase-like hydrolase/transferase [Verrucomicrobiota bacterium]
MKSEDGKYDPASFTSIHLKKLSMKKRKSMNLLYQLRRIILGLSLMTAGAVAQDKPNIVFLYIDDWAWGGTPVAMHESMKNSKMPILQMPNLEKMAAQGMTFTNAYGSPQCAPARACVQTGQSNPNNGLTLVLGKTSGEYYDKRKKYSNLPLVPNVAEKSLAEDAVTIPEVLKPQGYVSAHIGKWHLYCDPGEKGYVLHDGDTDNTPGNTLAKLKNESGDGGGKQGKGKGGGKKVIPDNMTDPKLMFSITEKAIGFMEEQARAKRPFFLMVSHYAMHSGSECLPATREKYAALPEIQAYYERNGMKEGSFSSKRDPAVWFGMGEDLDGRIGALFDKMDQLGIRDNTYVVLASDNGYRHKELLVMEEMTQPLHGHKWWAWDGGIRVPMLAMGPGIKPGSVFKENVINYDFLPTFLDWAGGDPKSLENVDGVSLADYMKGKEPTKEFINRPLYFHLPHYREEIPHSAIIAGRYKLMHFYDAPETPMLFDLQVDPGEVSNVAKEFPEKHRQMLDQMMSYLKKVDARIPMVNPDYDPEVYKSLKNYKQYLSWGAFEGKRPLAKDEK